MTKPRVFILDVDGVMTNGQFLYSKQGKVYKIFGPDDNDGLALVRPHMEIRFLTSDKRGLPITRKRIEEDMHYPLDLVGAVERVAWIAERYPLEEVIYMGDGILDHYVFRKVAYAIAPANASPLAKRYAHHVTERAGGDRAVAEACLHVLERFFDPYDPEAPISTKVVRSVRWTA